MPENVPFVDAFDHAAITALRNRVAESYAAALADVEPETATGDSADVAAEKAERTPLDLHVPEFEELIGIDPTVYEQINAALKSGKRHLMFYGPPGTGKTTLAQLVASAIADPDAILKWKLITGSSDWSSQDIIGGYQPVAGNRLKFMRGAILEHFDKPVIIDELNRCDIDKVLGPLFTVLSGQSTTLPYLVDIDKPESGRVTILPEAGPTQEGQFAPGEAWRLIATINTVDKGSLYQMSYALMRRFAWVFIDVPSNLAEFVWKFLAREKLVDAVPEPLTETPLSQLWAATNRERAIGPAPFIDMIRYCAHGGAGTFSFAAPLNEDARRAHVQSFETFVLPMLDGIRSDAADRLSDSIAAALGVTDPAEKEMLRKRVGTAAI